MFNYLSITSTCTWLHDRCRHAGHRFRYVQASFMWRIYESPYQRCPHRPCIHDRYLKTETYLKSSTYSKQLESLKLRLPSHAGSMGTMLVLKSLLKQIDTEDKRSQKMFLSWKMHLASPMMRGKRINIIKVM